MIATRVLPEPTSPWSSRCIGTGRAMSAAMASIVRCWSPVSSYGSDARNRGAQLAVDGVRDARRLGLDRALARRRGPPASGGTRRSAAAAAPCAPRRSTRGWWTSWYAVGALDELELAEHVLGQRLGQLAHPLQRERDDGLHLPRRHVGLPRLRVDRHDDPRLRVAGPAEHVDDRVRELPLAAVHVELPVERDLGARGRAASRATAG